MRTARPFYAVIPLQHNMTIFDDNKAVRMKRLETFTITIDVSRINLSLSGEINKGITRLRACRRGQKGPVPTGRQHHWRSTPYTQTCENDHDLLHGFLSALVLFAISDDDQYPITPKPPIKQITISTLLCQNRSGNPLKGDGNELLSYKISISRWLRDYDASRPDRNGVRHSQLRAS